MSDDNSIPKITVEPSDQQEAPKEGKTTRTNAKTLVISDIPSKDIIPEPEPLNSKYVILEKIGDGGMGIVYLAQDKKLGRYVAIKRLNSSSLSRPSLRKRFFQEAKAIAALRHIHIVHVYALSEDNDGPYIVMEYISGPPESSPNKTPPTPFALDDKVHRDGPMPTGDAIDLIIKLCRAVEYAHSCGIIHRDLKPSNILFDEGGEPKIVDFGLARTMEEGIEQLTVPGEKMLSLGYGAPEQEHDASKTDERADVYGLGALLYFSLTGQNPRYFRPDDVPESIRMVIVKALEPDRNRRWARARELLDALLLIKAPSTVELPTVKRTWRCTWCDTVNPVSIRYCGKCGWDGGVLCDECGSEMRVGIPFCGHCGADARDYEMATKLYSELAKNWDRKEYRNIMERAGAISGFTPGGPEGRKMVGKIYEFQKKAETALKRREKLRQMIPMDISTKDYERARSHIEEYNNLSNDNTFAEELANMDKLVIRRDLDQIVMDIETRKWGHALEVCTHLLNDVDPYNSDARRMLKRIRYHKARLSIRNALISVILVFIVYIISAAPIYRLMGKPRSGIYFKAYGLVGLIHDFSTLTGTLDKYAALWGTPTMFTPAPEIDESSRPPVAEPSAKIELAPLRAKYEKDLRQIEDEFKNAQETWPSKYMDGLQELQRQAQTRGDYEGWEAVQTEMDRFVELATLSEMDILEYQLDLKNLQQRQIDMLKKSKQTRESKVSTITVQYLAKLTELRKKLTKAGQMEKAKSVNEEIERIKGVNSGSSTDERPPEAEEEK